MGSALPIFHPLPLDVIVQILLERVCQVTKIYFSLAIKMVIVLRGNCPTNRGNCPRGNCPTGVVVLGGSCPGGNCPQGSCPIGVIVLRGSYPRGSCPVTMVVLGVVVPGVVVLSPWLS